MSRFCGKDIDESILKACFNDNGIKNWEKWNLSYSNLITGENGMGKSRLLLAVREVCRQAEIPCLYIDFTRVQEKLADKNKNPRNLANPLLYYGSMSDEAFSDFIPFLEDNLVSFSNYINRLSSDQLDTVVGERREEINRFLHDHLGRELIFKGKDGKCFISSRQQDHGELPFLEAVNEMSPGERCILYFALGVLCITGDRKCNGRFVLLLDEPENHLHTKALLKLVRAVKELNTSRGGHMLIASHSIFLIPLFQFNEIRLIENGEILRPKASLYQDAYNALVGSSGADGGSLQQMLSSIYHWNFCNFLSECLYEPTIADQAKKKDPQLKKLLKVIESYRAKSEIRLLDYGGGSGRIAKCLQLHFQDNPNDPLLYNLTYDIYDPLPEYANLPRASWMGRTYDESSRNTIPQKRYDLVVVYNVLHEIDVTEWKDTLNGILDLLCDNGVMVFGERIVLSQGERPYGKSGYLVLGKEELSLLFGRNNIFVIPLPKDYTESPESGSSSPDPTECCIVKSPRTISITDDVIAGALKHLAERSKKEVIRAIEAGPSRTPARQYAFYCQQYINAEHAIGWLEKPKEQVSKTISPAYSLADLIQNYSGNVLRRRVEERALFGDKEAQKCKDWLEENS